MVRAVNVLLPAAIMFRCKQCEKNLSSNWHLTRHNDTVHKGKSPIPCPKACGYATARNWELTRHLRTCNFKNKQTEQAKKRTTITVQVRKPNTEINTMRIATLPNPQILNNDQNIIAPPEMLTCNFPDFTLNPTDLINTLDAELLKEFDIEELEMNYTNAPNELDIQQLATNNELGQVNQTSVNNNNSFTFFQPTANTSTTNDNNTTQEINWTQELQDLIPSQLENLRTATSTCIPTPIQQETAQQQQQDNEKEKKRTTY